MRVHVKICEDVVTSDIGALSCLCVHAVILQPVAWPRRIQASATAAAPWGQGACVMMEWGEGSL